MDVPLWVWLLLVVLLFLSGLFSSSETALFSLSASQRGRAGVAARRLLQRPRDLLVVVLIGNILINVLFFAFVTRLHSGDEGDDLLVDAGALLALLLCGEILPKTIGLRSRVGVARVTAPVLAVFGGVIKPLRAVLRRLLEVAGTVVSRFVRDDEVTPEDLAQVLASGAAEGALHTVEAGLLAEIVELDDIRVREIMTPRVDALFVDLSEEDRREVSRRAVLEKRSWLPVVDGNPDQLVGQVRVRDLVTKPERSIAQLVMPVKFVPEVASALDLLRTLQEDRVAEAVVLDEWGGTAGIVTIEDVFEEIVGELRAEGETQEADAVPLGDGRFRVPGSLSIRDWNERFGLRVVPTEFETVGGFVTALLGRIPRTGDTARFGTLKLEVKEARGRRVMAVEIRVEDDEPDALARAAAGGEHGEPRP
ncbi:MAG: hemolysin family protein [Planctomycetota bacterium]